MIQVFGIRPAWGLPCVSPYVTKLVYWLRWQGIAHQLQSQDASRLREDSPSGKLPYVLLPDGERLADSSAIIERLGGADEAAFSPRERAQSLAFTRLVDEHLVWHGIVEPRWAVDAHWRQYRTVLFGSDELPAPVVELAEAIRAHVLAQWRGCGLGVLPPALREARARADVQALADQLGDRTFLFGDRPSRADVAVAALVDQVVQSPFDSLLREILVAQPDLPDLARRLKVVLV